MNHLFLPPFVPSKRRRLLSSKVDSVSASYGIAYFFTFSFWLFALNIYLKESFVHGSAIYCIEITRFEPSKLLHYRIKQNLWV
jgi:hypothetical protein